MLVKKNNNFKGWGTLKTKLIDWPTFIGAFCLLLAVTLPLVLFPDAGKAWVGAANTFMPLTLMFLGGLDTLQTASIVGGFPPIFIMLLLAWSFMRVSSKDIRASDEYESPTIHIKYRKKKRSPFDALKDRPPE